MYTKLSIKSILYATSMGIEFVITQNFQIVVIGTVYAIQVHCTCLL